MQTWELKCPHCGGPNAVAADRSCLACQFCGAGVWVQLPAGHTTLVAPPRIKEQEAVFAWDRHLKEAGLPLSRSPRDTRLLFLPFWRVTAIVAIRESTEPKLERDDFGWDASNAEGFSVPAQRETAHDNTDVLLGDWTIKPWDTTVPAFAEGIARLDSLGRRAETAPLAGWDRIVDADNAHRCRATLSGPEAMQRLAPAVASVLRMGQQKIEETRIIAPHLSLVYWPVWQLAERRGSDPLAVEIDGVSGRVLSAHSGALGEITEDGQSPGQSPALLPHRCVTCGTDLPIDDRYVVFVCPNCRSLTAHTESGQRISVEADFTNPTSRGELQWFPFWAFGEGPTLVPAFGIRNHRHRLRLGVIMSGSRRAVNRPNEHPRRLAGAVIGPEVAQGLAAIIRERGASAARVGSGSTTAGTSEAIAAHPRLVYAPMQTVGRELVDPVTGLCIAGNVITAT